MKLAVSLALLLTTPLAAQDYVGTWTKKLAWCSKPWGMWDRPFEITGEAIIMRQEYCYISKSIKIGNDKTAWLVDLHCGAEGDTFDTRNILQVVDDNTLWKWLDDYQSYKFLRCPE